MNKKIQNSFKVVSAGFILASLFLIVGLSVNIAYAQEADALVEVSATVDLGGDTAPSSDTLSSDAPIAESADATNASDAPASEDTVVIDADASSPETNTLASEASVADTAVVDVVITSDITTVDSFTATTNASVTDTVAISDTTAVEESTATTDISTTTDTTATTDSSTPVSTSSEIQIVQSPELSTDKADYHPGDTASIFGSFFSALQNFVLKIFGGSVETEDYVETIATVTSNESGFFSYDYLLDNYFRPLYTVVAHILNSDGSTGEQVAATTFTDAGPGLNLDQCQNGTLANLGVPCDSTNPEPKWDNGNINGSNSQYREGDGLPYRLAVTGLTDGTWTIRLDHDFTKGGVYAIDRLTSYNLTQASDPCSGLSNCAGTTPDIFIGLPGEVATPTGTVPVLASGGALDIAGTLSTVSSPTDTRIAVWEYTVAGTVSNPGGSDGNVIQNGLNTGDSDREFQIKVAVSSCPAGTGCRLMLGWTGHIASAIDWGAGFGASSITGAPFHMRVLGVDQSNGTSGGNQDRSVQLSALVVAPQGTISGVKFNDVNGNGVNDAEPALSGVTITLAGAASASTVTASDGTYSFGALADGVYTVCETVPSGYTQTFPTTNSGSCIGSTGYSVTISGGVNTPSGSLDFGNTQKATLTLVKTITTDNGGTAVATDWTLSASGPTPISGATGSGAVTGASVNAGTYDFSESGPAGYTASAWVCTGTGTQNDDDTVTLAAGQSATCTIHNDDVAPTITLIKTVINDNGGDALPDDFDLTVGGAGVLSGATTPVSANTSIALDETLVDGYAFVSLIGAGCPATLGGTVTLNEGEDITCTITNDDVAPTLTLVKTVINDNGGTKEVADFPLFVNGSPVASGVATTTTANLLLTSTETGATGYAASVWGGNCASDGTITLLPGDNKTCTITNDDVAPTLTLVKTVINDNGGTKEVADFPLFVNGSPVASGVATTTTANLLLTSTETGATGYAASVWGGNCASDGTITLLPGDNKTCTITNDDVSPILTIVKDADPNDLTDFSFNGTGIIGSFQLDDDQGVYLGDDTLLATTTFSNLLAGQNYTVTETIPNSFWTFVGANCVVTGTGTPYPFATSTNSVTVNLGLADDVTCTFTNEKESPTRTQGFWQTHTQYTTTVFNSAPLSGSMFIGDGGLHKGPVGTIDKVFGAYWSNIAMKSTGKGKAAQRTAVEKARMQLLQQLVTAKLNCAAFGCTASVQTMIAAADVAYAGTSVSAILASAGLLDAYNNSGDTILIGPAGPATPKISQSLADKTFWDNP